MIATGRVATGSHSGRNLGGSFSGVLSPKTCNYFKNSPPSVMVQEYSQTGYKRRFDEHMVSRRNRRRLKRMKPGVVSNWAHAGRDSS